jgi:hypothetical protein
MAANILRSNPVHKIMTCIHVYLCMCVWLLIFYALIKWIKAWHLIRTYVYVCVCVRMCLLIFLRFHLVVWSMACIHVHMYVCMWLIRSMAWSMACIHVHMYVCMWLISSLWIKARHLIWMCVYVHMCMCLLSRVGLCHVTRKGVTGALI